MVLYRVSKSEPEKIPPGKIRSKSLGYDTQENLSSDCVLEESAKGKVVALPPSSLYHRPRLRESPVFHGWNRCLQDDRILAVKIMQKQRKVPEARMLLAKGSGMQNTKDNEYYGKLFRELTRNKYISK